MLIPIRQLLNKYNLQPKSVLHLGANTGQEVGEYIRSGIQSGVFVEAIPDVFNILQHNLKGLPFEAVNACISDKDYETVAFNVASNGGQSSSLLKFGEPHLNAHPEVVMVEQIHLQTIRVDTLLASHLFDFINFDLQGSELMALKSMGEKIKFVECAYLEINKRETYKGAALLPEVAEFMNSKGLYMVEQSEWIGDTWADSFWVRRFES